MRADTRAWVLLAAAVAAGCAARDVRFPAPGPGRDASPQDLAAYDEAQALVARGQYAEAEARIGPLAGAFEAAGDRARTAEALFWAAYCREKQGRPDEAARGYEAVVRGYPETPASRQASARLDLRRPAPGPGGPGP